MSEIELNPYLWRDEGFGEFSKFHTRCLVGNNVCSLTIDSRSFVNVVSTWLVERLNLKTLKHPTPYPMQNECGKIMVSEQVLIAFSIGRYQDEVLCDVAPMQTSHILLGRPWHLDRRAKHDGHRNCYSIVINKRRVKLIPLEPMDALDDQLKILEPFRKREREKNEWKELECEARTSVSDIVEKESGGEEAINKDESFEGREKQMNLSDEKAEIENKREIKSDICFSTNDRNFYFPIEIDSSLQGSQDSSVQQIPVESTPLEELIPLSVDGFKKERTELVRQQPKLSNVSVPTGVQGNSSWSTSSERLSYASGEISTTVAYQITSK